LACPYMQPVVGEKIDCSKDPKYQHPAQQDGILHIIVSTI
jgi:hypothetical protein